MPLNSNEINSMICISITSHVFSLPRWLLFKHFRTFQSYHVVFTLWVNIDLISRTIFHIKTPDYQTFGFRNEPKIFVWPKKRLSVLNLYMLAVIFVHTTHKLREVSVFKLRLNFYQALMSDTLQDIIIRELGLT